MSTIDRDFKHSGKLGDIIYSLPAIRALGGGILHLAESPGLGFGPHQVQAILPLLRIQPYIRGIKIWSGKRVEYDLDRFRTGRTDRENLASIYLKLFGLPDSEKDSRWLDVPHQPSRGDNRVLLSRSLAHHGVTGFWPAVLDRFGDRAAFVGTVEEHERFTSEFGFVPYEPTSNLLELAEVISSAGLSIGNQSCPYAIAEGLKVPTIQESDTWSPNCVFHRPAAFYASNERHVRCIANGCLLKPNAEEVARAARPKMHKGPFVGELGPATCRASVVILTYNSMGTIESCLKSVVPTLGSDDELLLVDNASTDGTAEFLSGFAAMSNATVILNQENRGFSAANNQALLQSRGRYLVLLNPDTLVQPGWLEAFVNRFQDPEIAAVGPVADNGLAMQFVGFHLPPGQAVTSAPEELSAAVQRLHPGRSIETKLLIGFCLTMRRDVLDKLGLLDETMFLGSEDLEISWRIREAGYKLLVARDILVAHRCGSSFSSLSAEDRDLILSDSTRALVSRVRAAYSPTLPPTSTELWGIDIVPDEHMLMNLEDQPMKTMTKKKKPPRAKPSARLSHKPPISPIAIAQPEPQPPKPGFIEQWCGEDSLNALEALGHKVEHLEGAILELGCWEGASTCAIANAVHPETVIAVDTWQGNLDESPDHATVQILKSRDVKATFEANIAAFTKGNVCAAQSDCHQFLAGFFDPVKLCHIDACHDYNSVKRTIEAVLPKVVPGGVLCGDDIRSANAHRADLKGGVERAVSELLPGYFTRGNFWYWVNPDRSYGGGQTK